MKNRFGIFLSTAAVLALAAAPALAETTEAAASSGNIRVWYYIFSVLAAAICMTLATLGIGFAQTSAVKTAVNGIARNPGASGKILPTLLIGLAMMESLAIYVLVIALILLFTNPFLQYIG